MGDTHNTQKKTYIMALDQGTTSSRCILFDKQGNICSMAQKEFTQIYPQPGWVEHNPMEIWSSQLGVAIESMAVLGITDDQIEAIGITNQRETTIIWDKNTGFDQIIRKKTGLIPDAYFSASKIAWILNNVPGVRERAERGELLFGTVDTWLIWNLTKGAVHVTDYTNASRTISRRVCCPGYVVPVRSTAGPMLLYWAARFLLPVRRETNRRRCSDSAALSREK